MKKFMLIGVGAVLFASTIIPFSDASRILYHKYQTGRVNKQYLRTQHFGNLELDFLSRRKYLKNRSRAMQVRNVVNRGENNFKKFTRLRNDVINSFPRKDRLHSLELADRPSTNRWYSNFRNFRQPRQAIAPRFIAETNAKFSTYTTGEFSFQLPQNFLHTSVDGNHYFASPGGDFTVEVKKFSPEICKDSPSFQFCAIKIAKHQNRLAIGKAGKFLTNSRIVRQNQFSDTVFLAPELQTATYSESFSTKTFNSAQEIFVTRFMVADLDGDVFFIETRSDIRITPFVVDLVKKIQDSAHIDLPSRVVLQ